MESFKLSSFGTRMPDGEITGTLLKQMTGRVNRAFDTIMPLILSYSDHIRWDDTNHSDRPFGTIDIVSGQHDYTITGDDNSLDILNLTGVRILTGASETEYKDVSRMLVSDPQVKDALVPNPSSTGIPTHFVEQGNSIFFNPVFNYSATAGIQLFFERQQSYFTSTDTTKEPGIPLIFHELLALHPALDWISVNRPEDSNTIARIERRIASKEKELFDLISLRNPTKARLTTSYQGNSGNISGRITQSRSDSSK